MRRKITTYHLAFNFKTNMSLIRIGVEHSSQPIDINLTPDNFNAVVNVLKEGNAFLEGDYIVANN